jgi:tRNA uridine 5-carbamoylmethylation protein Kti12
MHQFRSGKTHFANEIYQQLSKLQFNVSRISFDDYELSKAQWNENSFHLGRENALDALNGLLSASNIVIVDDIMYLRSMRKRVYALGRIANCMSICIHLKVSLETACLRNNARSDECRVDNNTLLSIYNNIEPCNAAHVCDRYHHEYNTENFEIMTTNLHEFIESFQSNYLHAYNDWYKRKLEADCFHVNNYSNHSSKHTLDNLLRKV